MYKSILKVAVLSERHIRKKKVKSTQSFSVCFMNKVVSMHRYLYQGGSCFALLEAGPWLCSWVLSGLALSSGSQYLPPSLLLGKASIQNSISYVDMRDWK